MSETIPAGRGLTLSRADVILLCLPLLFVAGYAVGTLLFQTQALAVAVAAVSCYPLLGDGLFLHPPTDR